MCCIKPLIIFSFLVPLLTIAQSKTSIDQYHVVGNNHDYVPMSVAHFQNNKNWYAEGRYNYEDVETLSFYVGKTFSKESKLSYALTPIVGGAVGNFTGVSTGLNIELDYNRFFFSLQPQYSFSTGERSDNFFYNWSELAYQPLEWLYAGVSFQHTRLYHTKPAFESGILVAFTFRNLTIPVYAFAPLNNNRYFMFGLTIEWEKSQKRKINVNTLAEVPR